LLFEIDISDGIKIRGRIVNKTRREARTIRIAFIFYISPAAK
jgi:hypothetical protein